MSPSATISAPAEPGPGFDGTPTATSKAEAKSQIHRDYKGRNAISGLAHAELYSNTAIAKIWKTATEHLEREVRTAMPLSESPTYTKQCPPRTFPETVPQTGDKKGIYQYRDAEFWTCGFFPGSLYCLLERSVKYPQRFLAYGSVPTACRSQLRNELLQACRAWSEPLHDMAHRKDTHDIGFIVEPALRRDFELTGSPRSYQSLLTAAESLASRYSDEVKAIRSWDTFVNNGHNFNNKDDCFLLIIDSMCNLDLLFYAGHHISSQRLIDIATVHAHTIRNTHLRPERTGHSRYQQYSTCHVANVCSKTGNVLQRLTAQGYSDDSTWSRGQAWAILGYAQTYSWTKDRVFLDTACGLAEHLIARLEAAHSCVEVVAVNNKGRKAGRYVPLWDFDAPINEGDPLRDSSAGMIAANGLLIMANCLSALGESVDARRFLEYALVIVEDTITLCYPHDTVHLRITEDGTNQFKVIASSGVGSSALPFDAILERATANFNSNWTDKYYDHGLVYGDYYFLEFGNRLLQMGYC